MAPNDPSRAGRAPHRGQPGIVRALGAARGGRRCRLPGSPDVAVPRGGAADALLNPGRRLVLKGQSRVRAGGGGAFCPCGRPLPQGHVAASAAPSPFLGAGVGCNWSAVPGAPGWPQMAARWPGFPPAERWPVAPRGAERRRPVIGRSSVNAGHCLVAAVSVPASRPSTHQNGCGARALDSLVPTHPGVPSMVGTPWWENVTFRRS